MLYAREDLSHLRRPTLQVPDQFFPLERACPEIIGLLTHTLRRLPPLGWPATIDLLLGRSGKKRAAALAALYVRHGPDHPLLRPPPDADGLAPASLTESKRPALQLPTDPLEFLRNLPRERPDPATGAPVRLRKLAAELLQQHYDRICAQYWPALFILAAWKRAGGDQAADDDSPLVHDLMPQSVTRINTEQAARQAVEEAQFGNPPIRSLEKALDAVERKATVIGTQEAVLRLDWKLHVPGPLQFIADDDQLWMDVAERQIFPLPIRSQPPILRKTP